MLSPEALVDAVPAYWQAAYPELKKIERACLQSAQQGAPDSPPRRA